MYGDLGWLEALLEPLETIRPDGLGEVSHLVHHLLDADVLAGGRAIGRACAVYLLSGNNNLRDLNLGLGLVCSLGKMLSRGGFGLF